MKLWSYSGIKCRGLYNRNSTSSNHFWDGISFRYKIKPTRSTQSCILLGSLNWVPTFVMQGKESHLCQVAGNTAWSHDGMRVPVSLVAITCKLLYSIYCTLFCKCPCRTSHGHSYHTQKIGEEWASTLYPDKNGPLVVLAITLSNFDRYPQYLVKNISSVLIKKNTHTHTFNGPFSRTAQVSRYQKGKTNLDFTEARDSEWQWHQLDYVQVCTSLQTDNHASIPPLSFLQARCPSCRSTNSVKALKNYEIRWLKTGQLNNRSTDNHITAITQVNLAAPVMNWVILLEHSFFAHMPLLTANSAFRLRRRLVLHHHHAIMIANKSTSLQFI